MPSTTLPAAATGLPTRRTAMLASLAGLGAAVSLPKAAKAAASADHPDARLLALYAEWQQAAERSEAATDAFTAAERRWVYPETPVALFHRPDDFHVFYGWHGTRDADGRWWYGLPHTIEHMREIAAKDLQHTVPKIVAAFEARRAEILSSYDSWRQAIAASRRAYGVDDAERLMDEANACNRALRRSIGLTPAVTLDGLLAKYRVALWCNCEWSDDVADRLERGDVTDEVMLTSAMRDLVAFDARQKGGDA